MKIHSLYGRRPKYCNEVVDGVSHDAKTAAQYRKMFNIPADKPGTANIRAAAASQPAPASNSVTSEAFSVTPEADETPAVSFIPSTDPAAEVVTESSTDQTDDSVTVRQSDSPVTDAVSRFADGTETLQRVVQQLTEVAALVVPDITGALESAAPAIAAEREVGRVRRQAAQQVERAQDALTQANIQRDRAEKRAEEAEAARDAATTEKASAQAVAEWLVAEALWMADQTVAAVEAERDQARAERDAANRAAAEAKEDAESRIDAANKTADEKVEAAQKDADKKIAAANEERSTAVGEANRLREEAAVLNQRIDRMQADHQATVESTREFYMDRIKDLLSQNDRQQRTIDGQITIITRLSGGGLAVPTPAAADSPDELEDGVEPDDSVADSSE
ncbi:hypothetical protein AB0H58_32565 [Nocardia neocaledoniensis]|uniref:hypothetical protein n=1 Tax=Nocardia neocaledoniensis TaxID=236511 RepID=UPI003408EFAA